MAGPGNDFGELAGMISTALAEVSKAVRAANTTDGGKRPYGRRPFSLVPFDLYNPAFFDRECEPALLERERRFAEQFAAPAV